MAVAVRHWTRAVGAALSGRVESAEEELQHLRRISTELRDHPDVWARNISRGLELQAAAWLELERGERGRAVELMRSAAVLEDETDKSSLSPGRVLPAREQLGDLLLELGRPEEALSEYEASLQHNGYRFNSIYGAARAARAAGREDVARAYYENLLEVSAPESRRPEVRERGISWRLVKLS